ncbi:cortistatin isoform 2-T2 [Callospermophilus lateralis]
MCMNDISWDLHTLWLIKLCEQHMQEVAEIKKNGLLTFLAWWHEWTSQASPGALTGGHASEVSKRQEGPPLQQPRRQDKTPCKNFFWKTFSSCK